ncbi:hypothetical protein RJT34_16237 [Clitoria ternatea]|uniref:Uncharacterized protein n=1 Tax=Clitoria ternatea TaxID=43366 RepID=A0AAN9PDH0_CLITE
MISFCCTKCYRRSSLEKKLLDDESRVQSEVSASNILNTRAVFSNFLPVIGAFLANAYFGKFLMLVIGSIANFTIIGIGMQLIHVAGLWSLVLLKTWSLASLLETPCLCFRRRTKLPWDDQTTISSKQMTYYVEIAQNVSTRKKKKIEERVAQLDVVMTNKTARLHIQEGE